MAGEAANADFATHYRQIAVPQLRRLAKAEAASVAAGVETFIGAYGALDHHARLLGCLFLSEALLGELEDWMATTLLLEIQALEAAGEADV
jgi:hypothetical protein